MPHWGSPPIILQGSCVPTVQAPWSLGCSEASACVTGHSDWSPNLRPASTPALRHGLQVLIFMQREARSAGAPSGVVGRSPWPAGRPLESEASPSPWHPRAPTAAPALAMEVQMLPFRELERNPHLRVDQVVV